MKKLALISGLFLILLVAGVYGSRGERGKPDSAKCAAEIQLQEKAAPTSRKELVDTAGRKVREDETFIALKPLSDERTTAYRRNRKDARALVEALKKEGVTDRILLNPEVWLMGVCGMTSSGGCTGKCLSGQCLPRKYVLAEKKAVVKGNLTPYPTYYCSCN